MAEGLLTEREWRKQTRRTPGGAVRCWGAQCVRRPPPPLVRRRAFHGALLLLSFVCAMLLPTLIPVPEKAMEYQTLNAETAQKAALTKVRPVSAVAYTLPGEVAYVRKTYPQEELLRGKLLLIDENHPLPKNVPAPNTMSVATCGKGMVPVTELSVKSGKETVAALTGLFAALRGKGAGGFTVCRGTMTPLEQREWRLEQMKLLTGRTSLDEARRQACLTTDAPGSGELQQEYSVDLRLAANAVSDFRPLTETGQGITLLQTAWRYGFIPISGADGNPWEIRLRYVGQAHATAMTYLNLPLKEYLELLHHKRVLQVRRDEKTSYLILCLPLNGNYVEFSFPRDAACEASLDNMGYALLACTLTS